MYTVLDNRLRFLSYSSLSACTYDFSSSDSTRPTP